MKETRKTKKHRKEGILFIVSAPSGAGKSTLCQKLLRNVSGLKLSVSYTTREPRKGEVDGVHYSFISERKFKGMIHKGAFAEWARVHGNFYGTTLKRLKKLSKAGYDIILDIDVQGARQLKKSCGNAVFIFILPPSMRALKKRLLGRRTESEDRMKIRLERAKDEITGYKDYDYVIINDRLEKAYREFESVVLAERQRIEHIDSKVIRNILREQ